MKKTGKVWVLDTETKGTGANMVPLEKLLARPRAAPTPLYIPPKPEPKAAPTPEPAPAPRFKLVDLMTRQTLVQDANTRTAVDALKRVRSIVDVNIYVRRPQTGSWRLLTREERRAMWALRER